MCTLVLAVDPGGDWDVLIAATRDEFRSREWRMPAAWWPSEFPEVVGGRDLQAGGTWLAVDRRRRRVAAVLNRMEPSDVTDRDSRSRGILPLIAVARGTDAIGSEDLQLVRPFNLVTVESEQVTWWRYDGESLSRHEVSPGLHIITAADMDDMGNPRQRRWLPEFKTPPGPAPDWEDRAPGGWGSWPELLADVDSPADDPRALNVRRLGPDGEFGTVSASLLAVGGNGVKFECSDGPPDAGAWQRII
jgi:hypothetical protein